MGGRLHGEVLDEGWGVSGVQPQMKGETHAGVRLPGGEKEMRRRRDGGHGGGTRAPGRGEPTGIENSGGTAVCRAGR